MPGSQRRAPREAQHQLPAASKLKLPYDDGVAAAAENRALAVQPAVKHTAARARLERGELAPSEALGPIWHQRRMCGAGDRILVDAEVRHKHPADDIFAHSARGNDGHATDRLECSEIR